MKYIKEEILINKKLFSTSREYKRIRKDIIAAIKSITWPSESNIFMINPQKHGNGVVPIKQAFIAHLQKLDWRAEVKVDVGATTTTPGKIDAVKIVDNGYFAVEWETGNISSSHRALNKIAIGILSGKLVGGSLVIPTRRFYRYLTDRIGNYSELEPYFPIWRSINCKSGFLSVIAIEHDDIGAEVPLIRKGTDGRALL
ncbi:MAG: hypothetical protein JW730_21215 [Anaerolineales bacterium]|nr:hypothetical protein [Anaerolineales bacterium]